MCNRKEHQICFKQELDSHTRNATITIPECRPRYQIETLECFGEVSDLTTHISYVMHKYPRLNEITLQLSDSNGFKTLSYSILNQLLIYISKIESVHVDNLLVPPEVSIDAIGCFLKLLENSVGKIHFQLRSMRNIRQLADGNKVCVCIDKSGRHLLDSVKISVDYSSEGILQKYINLFKNYGYCIGNLTLG
jgi:hypothetical protein